MKFIDEKDIFYINNKFILINYLTGACDIINDKVAKDISHNEFKNLDTFILNKLISRKYIFPSTSDYNYFIKKIDEKLRAEKVKRYPNFLIIPTYECNLSCPYCFENTYKKQKSEQKNSKWIENIFYKIDNINKDFSKRNNIILDPSKIEITLMGGEPLLPKNKKNIEDIINHISAKGYKYNIITNGVCIDEYVNLFIKNMPTYIQITLDGTKEYHDQRRCYIDGNGTFDKIMRNINILTNNRINISIRLNLDQNNLDDLKPYINFIEDKFKNNEYVHPYLYPIQDGGCAYNNNIGEEIDYIKKINILSKNLNIKKFRFIFHGNQIIECIKNNVPIKLKSYNCSAQNNQYIFDFKGNIYKCWFGVGNDKYAISSDASTTSLIDETWKSRTIYTLKKCSNCKYRYLCGGGCVNKLLSQNQNINQPNCKDYYNLIKEQLKGII